MFTKMSRVVMSNISEIRGDFKNVCFVCKCVFLFSFYGNCIDFLIRILKYFFQFLKSFIEIYFT